MKKREFQKKFWPAFYQALCNEHGTLTAFSEDLLPEFEGEEEYQPLKGIVNDVFQSDTYSEAMGKSGLFDRLELAGIYYGEQMGILDEVAQRFTEVYG